ncbi:MAG: endopeptidase [Deltaproteobacteria bacterium]|nr:endopeptidase [Deltaproteobacteria bacterium]HCH62364.1 endopeptidase [Deltaproteobacteria bacterium]
MSILPSRNLFVLAVGSVVGAGVVGVLPGSLWGDCEAATQPASRTALAPAVESGGSDRGASDLTPRRSRGRSSAARGPLSPTTYNPSVSLAPLVDELGPAVVHIKVAQTVDTSDIPRHMRPFIDPEQLEGFRMRQGEGTGFFISADGYLLTNDHVVSGADEVTVTLLDERTLPARVVGTDPNTDIALVKVDTDAELPFVQLGSSGEARVGDRVVAIGNPFGLSHTVTEGILSAKGRVIGAGPYDDFLQTDASINPGNSGGPLFNLRGEVIGINTAINPRGQGIGFSVPIDQVQPLVEDLKDDGKVSRGWVGVSLDSLADRRGTVVRGVFPGTPAADAGLEAGDIIVALDGKTIGDSASLVREIGMHPPGHQVVLNVRRGEQAMDVAVKLGERPERDQLEGRRR